MPGICTAIVREGVAGCGHLNVTVSIGGQSVTLHLHESELDEIDLQGRVRAGLKRLKDAGVSWDVMAGRCVEGEEATNVKQYTFCGPGAAIAMTNMRGAGANNYANICPGLNGEWILVDLTGCTEFRPMLTGNLVAVGPFQFRIVRDSDNAVFYESPSVTQTGERELDPGWVTIPDGFSGQEKLRIQARSAVATDDPVIRRAQLGVR